MNCESLFLSNACIGAKTLAGETMKYCLHVISLALLVGTPGCVSRTQESTQGSMLLELRKAETGDVRAQYDVGRYYVTGRDSYEHRAEAVNWFRKAAEQNDAKAQTALGVSYLRGQGVALCCSVATAAALSRSELVTPVELSVASGRRWWATWKHSNHLEPAMRLLEWSRALLNSTKTPHVTLVEAR